jgi:hypothetical protein
MVNKTRLAGIALGVTLLIGGASTTKAEHWSESKCRSKIQKEQRELDRAVYRFGPFSRKANEERRELNRILERCEYDGYRGYRDDQFFNRKGP